MIVLDSHVWFWWSVLPAKLSRRARQAITGAASIGVSPLSCYEIVWGVRAHRIALDRPISQWLRDALSAEGIRLVDLHPAAAQRAAQLGAAFPGDPIDRLLYATAVHLGVPLVTRDRRLRAADPERTLW